MPKKKPLPLLALLLATVLTAAALRQYQATRQQRILAQHPELLTIRDALELQFECSLVEGEDAFVLSYNLLLVNELIDINRMVNTTQTRTGDDWLFRLTYDPNDRMLDKTPAVVTFYPECFTINGLVYRLAAPDGAGSVAYSAMLPPLEALYEYYYLDVLGEPCDVDLSDFL